MFSTNNYERYFYTLFSFFCLLFFSHASVAQDDAYCIPEVGGEDLYITHFYFNEIDNSSGNDGYMYFPNPVTTLVPGFTYNYSINFSISGSNHFTIYVDLNGDGAYSETTDRLVNGTTSASSVTGLITIPSTPDYNINSRLRVMVSKDPILSSCLPISEGDVEDYSYKRTGKPDGDWDIVVSAGLYVPSQTGDDCGSIKFKIEALNCMNNGAISPSSAVSYGVTIFDPAFDPTSNLNPATLGLPFYTKTLSSNWGNTGSMDVIVPVENSTAPYFKQGVTYNVWYQHGLNDVDCYNGTDLEQIEIHSFPDCGGEKAGALARPNEINQINQLDNLNDSESIGLLVNPNPFQDQITVQYQLEKADKISIELFDIYGKKVMNLQYRTEQYPGSYQQRLELSQLASGAYYLLINGMHFYHSEKLIKM